MTRDEQMNTLELKDMGYYDTAQMSHISAVFCNKYFDILPLAASCPFSRNEDTE